MNCLVFSTFLAGLFCLSPAWGQDNPDNTGPVSRQEFNQVKKELADVKKQEADQQTNADQDAQDSDKRMKDLSEQIAKFHPGLEQFVLAATPLLVSRPRRAVIPASPRI